MKSCIEWRKTFRYLDQVDEYNISFKNKTKQLLYFLDQYATGEKRVNIILDDNANKDDIDLIIAIYNRDKYNIAVSLASIDTFYINQLKESNIPFYLQNHINSWDALYYAIDLGVSDVFITDELGFDLKRVHKKTKEAGIKIRCYANISQTQYPYENNDGLKGFYIRPEDIGIYNKYIDILEFYKSTEQQNILYEIYFKSKKWDGPLKDLIKGLKNDVDNYYILGKDFAKIRLDCQKKCLKGHGCQICEITISLANTLRDSQDYQVYRLDKKEKNDG